MTILSAQSIRHRCFPTPHRKANGWQPMIEPFCERTIYLGVSFGIGSCGYDIRVAETMILMPANSLFLDCVTERRPSFALASSLEHFNMPNDLCAHVRDKSTWARMGLAVQNTVIEPGWRGYLTLELTNHSLHPISITAGMAIAQLQFEMLDQPTDVPYNGKYQDQQCGVQEPIFEAMEPKAG